LNIDEETPSLAAEPAALSLPMPVGFERIKLLITVGLHDEARRELAAIRKKNGLKQKTLLGLARLYQEMEDYNSAAAIYRGNIPRRVDSDSLTQWGLLYPKVFRDAVTRQAADQGVAEELIYAVIKAESTFSPTVVSPAGAVGLMQLMPSTAKAMVNANGTSISTRLTDPGFNISLGVRHLKGLLQQYNGSIVAAVAAYNAGSTPVDRWRRTLPYQRDDEFIENIPYPETREYVKKVLANAEMYRTLYRTIPEKEPESVMQKADSGIRNPE
jgi:soluble lytic murein transglycosylase